MSELVEPLEDQALRAAQLYLRLGPAPLTELIRVLAGHLESPPPAVRAAVLALTGTGMLSLTGHTVSLPAGSERRDTKEQER